MDIIDKKFNKIKIIKLDHVNADSSKMWLCMCDCGKQFVKNNRDILRGKNSGCRECQSRVDLTGEKIGFLTILKRDFSKKGRSVWLCVCDCGNQVSKLGTVLQRGDNKGCSECLAIFKADMHTKHGGSRGGKSRLFEIWKGMRKRCLNPKAVRYNRYGGRGIKVCVEWNDFAIFRDWALNNNYTDNLTIDRLNPNDDYKPSNCEWVTRSENAKRVANPKFNQVQAELRNSQDQYDYVLGQLSLAA